MKKLFFIVAAALTMVGCNNKYEFFNGQTQGTTYHIIMQSPTADIQQRIDEVLTQIDTTLSIFNPNSQISRFNRGEVTVVSKDFENCINQAPTAFIFSKGMYDITIAPLVDLWGFGPSGKRDVEPTQAQIDSVLQFVDQNKVRIRYSRAFKDDPRIQIDLSSIAKGYTVDKMCAMLDEQGIKNYLVEIGGEVRCKGISARGTMWRVGIDNPDYGTQSGAEQTIVNLEIPTGTSVATSGNYRNNYTNANGQRIVHTLNALTGRPQESRILSATVIAPTCARADAFATMLMTMGDPTLLNWYERRMGQLCHFLVVYSDDEGKTQIYKTAKIDNFIMK
jgi:thiamine biosynthesis lipoprotein